MPQEVVAQNIANGDAASLPSTSPSHSVSPNLVGRNGEGPTEDNIIRGRKPMKPRLGVKVPSQMLYSPIVTKSELAQELLERSLKKYPVYEPPEGGDVFFAIKLTQRLANHIVPSSATGSSSSAQPSADMKPKCSLFQQADSAMQQNNTPAQDQKVIADDKELLAILEGDVDPNWIPEIKPSQSSAQPHKYSTDFSHPTHQKLDPLLEKEIALKQLMEFDSPRKKKTESQDEKSPRKVKPKIKVVDGALGESNGNVVPSEGKIVKCKLDTLHLNKKQNRKRKESAEDTSSAKKQKLLTKRKSENSINGKVVKRKIVNLHRKKINSTNKNEFKNIVNAIESVVTSCSGTLKADKISTVHSIDKNKAVSEDIPPTNAIEQEKRLSASPKSKLHTEASVTSNDTNQGKNVSFSDDSASKHLDKCCDGSEADTQVNGNECKDTGDDQKSTDLPSGGKKRVRRTEIDKLLIDEGAINLLYEAELGDSRRRSAAHDNDASNSGVLKRPVNPKVNSSRWKKKNLILKTRLVKNAVLRLKSLQNPSVSLRTKRQLLRASEQPCIDSKMAPPKIQGSQEPPMTVHFDPSSPTQPVTCPTQLQLRAEASRIIRRHSSSSNFSSRSTSPTVLPRTNCDFGIQAGSSSNGQTTKAIANESQHNKLAVKQTTEFRKKGVPIFIRKVEDTQTYRGKKKNENEQVGADTLQKNVMNTNKSVRLSVGRNSINKIVPKLKTLQKDIETKNVINSPQHLTGELKSEAVKGIQKNIQKEKVQKLGKSIEQGLKVKKKDKVQKEGNSTVHSTNSGSAGATELTTCLAEAASAFAVNGKTQQSTVAQVTMTRPTNSVQKKDKNHPQSPNAASYNNLVKSLETDIQKQKRKDEDQTKSRTSIRQNAGIVSYRELNIRRHDGLVQIIMNPASTKMKNALNLQVLRELRNVLNQMRRDDSCLAVLLTSTGGLFCQGVDLHCLLHTNTDRRKTVGQEFAVAIKEFVRALAHFNKPLIAGINGAAVGLGVTILPFFDMVIASDKATFYTPYAKLGQVPEGGATMTFQYMFGNCLTSELLFGCRRITASEALHFGLVTRILWPDRFQEELIPIARGVSSQSAQAMEATKALLRHGLRTKLEASLESEMHLLVQHWCTNECQNNIMRFLEAYEEIGLQRQRIDPDL